MSGDQPIVLVEGAYYKITFTRTYTKGNHVVVILGKHTKRSLIYKIFTDDLDKALPLVLKETASYKTNKQLLCSYAQCSDQTSQCVLYETTITEKFAASSKGELLDQGYGIDVQVFKESYFTGFDAFTFDIEAISLDDLEKYQDIIKTIEECTQSKNPNVSIHGNFNSSKVSNNNTKSNNTKSQPKTEIVDRQRRAYLLHVLRITSPRENYLNSQTNQHQNYHAIMQDLCKSGHLTEVDLKYLQTQGVVKGDIGSICKKLAAYSAEGGKAPKKTFTTKGATGKKITILGRERNIYKVGRKQFIIFKKELIPIAKARELEKLSKKKSS